MAKDPYEEVDAILNELEKDYFPTLHEYREKYGDIDVFADYQNRLINLLDKVKVLPESDRQYEIISEIVMLQNSINALMH